MDYFIRAGLAYTEREGLAFSADYYAEFVCAVIHSPDAIVLVYGDPVTGHCAVNLQPLPYSGDVVGWVLSSWGKGGLKCFRKAADWARLKGAKYLMADSHLEPRIMKFYERFGMIQTDQMFRKVL